MIEEVGSFFSYEPLEPLPLEWKDSDEIFQIAETAGAADFKTKYPDWEVSLKLGGEMIDILWGMGILKSAGLKKFSQTVNISMINNTENDRYSPPVWVFSLKSYEGDDELNLFIDAKTGEVYGPKTSQESVNLGFEALANRAGDLVFVASICENYDLESQKNFGSSWTNEYYSALKDSIFVYNILAGFLVTINSKPSQQETYIDLSEGWIDSPDALLIAETRGGQAFRNLHGKVNMRSYVGAHASNEFALNYGKVPVWIFQYFGGGEELTVVFDAYTGTDLTTIEENVTNPIEYDLSQNFPNPFNPKTTFSYDVPVKSPVRIRVLNLTGQEVSVLVDEIKTCGAYMVTWNGMDQLQNPVGSGLYFRTKDYYNLMHTS